MSALTTPRADRRHGPRGARILGIPALVAAAADVVAPVWPLKTFIAVNPLQGLEDRPFEQAVLEAERHRAAHSHADDGVEAVNRELIKWCSVFFDDGQAAIPMPGRGLGLYRAFAELAPYDRALAISADARSFLASLPDSAEDAIAHGLERLEIADRRRESFLRQALAALPGWSGHVKWRESWQDHSEQAKRPATLVDYLAVRLVLTCILWPGAGSAEIPPAEPPAYLAGLPAAEARYRDALLGRLRPRARALAGEPSARPRPDAQLVFCIDVRSEPIRRAIEDRGDYETFGFAGFFGVPVRVKGRDDDHAHDSCPVLLRPDHEVRDRLADAPAALVRRHERGRELTRLPGSFYGRLKYHFATPFALVEMLGPWLGLRMLARTFAPSLLARLAGSVRRAVMPEVPTAPVLHDIPLEQRADFAESALRIMGLADNLAPLVVFCGHGSTTTNNAHASALDCGACGGNRGGPNARILAAILNDQDVRANLANRGLAIPPETLFLSGEHDTASDRIVLDPAPGAGPDHQRQIEQLRNDLAHAGARNARDRVRSLGLPALDDRASHRMIQHRSADWAEVRPEWGLARNAAFIVGPRALTRGIDLDGRCFLHSYDWTSDPSGTILAAILTAPMVVAQWINSQYFFSTVDNVAHGSGSKSTQNVAGKIGVMQGNASDLMHGLPLQSVLADHDRPYHEPLRLLTVVQAPRSTLDDVIRRHDVLRKLFGNGWVTLAHLTPDGDHAYLLNPDLTWREVDPAGARPAPAVACC